MTELATRRGTSNSNDRGSTEDRRRRREWLVETYRANVDGLASPDGSVVLGPAPIADGWITEGLRVVPVCRCYRCGVLLSVDTVTVDRIVPGCRGGTYRRNNIRPACGPCNSETGARLATQGKRRRHA
jgi:hypothetical protein